MFSFFAVLMVSGGSSALGETDSLMTLTIDKSIYLDGETIKFTGEVENIFSDTPVTIIVKSPLGNIVGVDQLTVNADKVFTSEIKTGSALMSASGIYEILVHYGTLKQTVSFELITSEKPTSEQPISGVVRIDDSNKSVDYEITGGKLVSITPNELADTLIVEINADTDGSLTLILPRTVFESQENDKDSEIFVYIDDKVADFEVIRTSTDRTISIAFPAGSEQIEIVGTFVIPEFGTIAAMILVVAIISIIAVSSKSRLSIMPRY